jgi:hypothetical protein
VSRAFSEGNAKKEEHYFDILVCCSGQHQVPRSTHKDHPFNQFTGAHPSSSLSPVLKSLLFVLSTN